jgi:hypothetical protein
MLLLNILEGWLAWGWIWMASISSLNGFIQDLMIKVKREILGS